MHLQLTLNAPDWTWCPVQMIETVVLGKLVRLDAQSIDHSEPHFLILPLVQKQDTGYHFSSK